MCAYFHMFSKHVFELFLEDIFLKIFLEDIF